MADSAVGMNINDIPDTPATPDQSASAVGMHIDDIPDQPQDQQQAQPASAAGMHIDDIPDQPHPALKAEGPGMTVLRKAASAVLPAAASYGPMMTGAGIGAELGTFGGPAAPITVPLGALVGGAVGGLAAGYVASTAQEKVKQVVGLDDSEQQAVNAKANPWSSDIGALIPNAVTFNVGNIGERIAQRLAMGAGNAALDIAQQKATSDQPIDWRDVALQGVAGAALNNPRPWARGMLTNAEQAGSRAGAKMFGTDGKALYPPGRPDLDKNMADQKAKDQATASSSRPATSSTRGASMDQAPPTTNIDASTLGDAKVMSSTPKSGDGGSDGVWAKKPPASSTAQFNTSDGTKGAAGDPDIAAAIQGTPSADELMAAHNAAGTVQDNAPPPGEPVPPGQQPMGNSNNTTLEQQQQQLNAYKQRVMAPPDQRQFGTTPNIETSSPEQIAASRRALVEGQPAEPAGTISGTLRPVGEEHAAEMNRVNADATQRATATVQAKNAGAEPVRTATEEAAAAPPSMADHLKMLAAAQSGEKTPIDAQPTPPPPKQTVTKTLELLRANGQEKLAAKLDAMPEGPAKDQRAAQLAAAAGSNVTGKVPGTLKNVRVRNPDKLADLNVEGYTNPRTGRPTRAKDFPQKYLNEAVHEVNDQVHSNKDLLPVEGETKEAVEARAQAILDDAKAKASAKADAMRTQADEMKAAADAMKPGNERKSAQARATAMRLAADRLGNGSLPVENYQMNGLHKPEAWRMQRHAKDFLEGKFPEVNDETDNQVQPHEKFLADEKLIRAGGEAYDAFVKNNQAEAETANKPEGKSQVTTAEGLAALTKETPRAATVQAPVEAAEPISAAEHYETEADRRIAETREDRVNDKLYSQGHGKIVDQLQKMPIGDARDNNYIALENMLLKGKQAGPGMQAMAKPGKPMSIPEAQALMKKVDEQAKAIKDASAKTEDTKDEAIDEFVKMANGEASTTAPPKAAEAIQKSVQVEARKGLLGVLKTIWGGGEHADTMSGIIRKQGGLTASIIGRAQRIMEGFTPTVMKLSEKARVAFMHAMDTGKELTGEGAKELAPVADWWHTAAEDVRNRIDALPDHEKYEWLKNYFPHYFTDGTAADQFVKDWIIKQGNANEGSAASLQHRTFPTIQDGLDAGLKLATTNPLEAMGHYLGSMHTYIAQQSIIGAAKDAGIVRTFPKRAVGASGHPEGNVVPEGWVELNGRAKYGEPLYAPADAAEIYNNYISKGWGKISPKAGRVASIMQRASNALTGLELSFNGYHFFTIGKEGMISQMARATKQAASGEFGKAFEALKGVPGAPVNLARRGAMYRAIANGELAGTPKLNEIIRLGTEAGARWDSSRHDPTYDFSPMHGYFKAWKQGSLKMELQDVPRRIKEAGQEGAGAAAVQVTKEAFGAIGRTMQTVGEPLFQHYIPNMKAAALHDNIADWLDAHPNASEGEKLAQARKEVDSIDNRFGEMVHDNIFWNKATKQTAMIGMRAYSWFLGTAREIGGGAVSAFQDPSRIAVTSPNHDPRAAYAVTMPILVALSSMAYQYLKAGKNPGDLKDLFVPQTGGTSIHGNPERAALPGYEKDVYGWLHNPTQEAVNKMATAPRLVWDILTNTDYKGAPITNANNHLDQRMKDYAGHVLDAMNPISVRNVAKTPPRGSNISLPERITAIRSAPTYLQDEQFVQNAQRKNNDKLWKLKVRQDVKAKNRSQ